MVRIESHLTEEEVSVVEKLQNKNVAHVKSNVNFTLKK